MLTSLALEAQKLKVKPGMGGKRGEGNDFYIMGHQKVDELGIGSPTKKGQARGGNDFYIMGHQKVDELGIGSPKKEKVKPGTGETSDLFGGKVYSNHNKSWAGKSVLK